MTSCLLDLSLCESVMEGFTAISPSDIVRCVVLTPLWKTSNAVAGSHVRACGLSSLPEGSPLDLPSPLVPIRVE